MSRFNKVLESLSSFELMRYSLVLCFKYSAELGY